MNPSYHVHCHSNVTCVKSFSKLDMRLPVFIPALGAVKLNTTPPEKTDLGFFIVSRSVFLGMKADIKSVNAGSSGRFRNCVSLSFCIRVDFSCCICHFYPVLILSLSLYVWNSLLFPSAVRSSRLIKQNQQKKPGKAAAVLSVKRLAVRSCAPITGSIPASDVPKRQT